MDTIEYFRSKHFAAVAVVESDQLAGVDNIDHRAEASAMACILREHEREAEAQADALKLYQASQSAEPQTPAA